MTRLEYNIAMTRLLPAIRERAWLMYADTVNRCNEARLAWLHIRYPSEAPLRLLQRLSRMAKETDSAKP